MSTDAVDTGTPDVTCTVDDGVATITIDRPDNRNAVRLDTVEGLGAAARALAQRPDVRIAVLTGAGDRFFCPGADLVSASGRSDGEHSGTDRSGGEVWRLRASVAIHEMPQITVAAINGACAGAGFGYAAACDLRVASGAARFATAFLDVTVAGDMGLPWTLSRIVGGAKARELFLLRGKFDADEALDIGFVSAVYPAESFRPAVDELIDSLKRYKPLALRTLKENFLSSERMGFADYLDLEHERHMKLVSHPDFGAAAQAFRRQR
jgi:2-(1,2-epoxy-1,2-dihydrophenyl)acetyl-CoA isomerase